MDITSNRVDTVNNLADMAASPVVMVASPVVTEVNPVATVGLVATADLVVMAGGKNTAVVLATETTPSPPMVATRALTAEPKSLPTEAVMGDPTTNTAHALRSLATVDTTPHMEVVEDTARAVTITRVAMALARTTKEDMVPTGKMTREVTALAGMTMREVIVLVDMMTKGAMVPVGTIMKGDTVVVIVLAARMMGDTGAGMDLAATTMKGVMALVMEATILRMAEAKNPTVNVKSAPRMVEDTEVAAATMIPLVPNV